MDYAAAIVGNIRAERARKGLHQADIVKGMRERGFTNWHRQTLAKIELGERRVLAAELLGMADVLNISAATLFDVE